MKADGAVFITKETNLDAAEALLLRSHFMFSKPFGGDQPPTGGWGATAPASCSLVKS